MSTPVPGRKLGNWGSFAQKIKEVKGKKVG
jgi:hypothetical protein